MRQITRGAVWFRVGPPRRLAGLAVRGYAIRFDVLLPPAEGAGRIAALEEEGRRLLAEARREYGIVLAQVLIAAGSAVPPPIDLDRPWRADMGREVLAGRRAQWLQTRRLLAGARNTFVKSSQHHPVREGAGSPPRLEKRARRALDAAVDAFNHLEDTALASEAHACAHTIGEMVAGLFGCRAQNDNGRWFDVCRLSLMHLRVGNSVGFVARRLCSLCGLDLMVCEHLPGATYSVTAGPQGDGSCNICGAERCMHTPGVTYPVVVHGIVREVDRLDEISLVARPRDPLARINAVEIPAGVIASLNNHDAGNAPLHCESCLAPCEGFTSVEEALGLA